MTVGLFGLTQVETNAGNPRQQGGSYPRWKARLSQPVMRRRALADEVGDGAAGSIPPSCGVHWFAGAGGVTDSSTACPAQVRSSWACGSVMRGHYPFGSGCEPESLGSRAAMTTRAQLDLLAAIDERAPDGLALEEDGLRGLGGDTFDDDLVVLESEGLVVRSDDPDRVTDTVAVSDEGRSVLRPRNSL